MYLLRQGYPARLRAVTVTQIPLPRPISHWLQGSGFSCSNPSLHMRVREPTYFPSGLSQKADTAALKLN